MLLLRLLASKDRGVYAFCSLIGYLMFLAFRPASWAGVAAVLLTYHLFLSYLVVSGESERDQTRSYGWPATIAAHLGFIVVCTAARIAVVALILDSIASLPKIMMVISGAMTEEAIGLVTVVLVYALVSFECNLLFSGKRSALPENLKELEPVLIEMSAKLRIKDTPLIAATGDDHYKWVQYCQRRRGKYYNPGLSPKDDFEQWLRARGKTQFPTAQTEAGVAAD